MKKKAPTLKTQLEQALKDAKSYKAGKVKFRTTMVGKDGNRTSFAESGPEEKIRRERLNLFKAMRAGLDLSQSEMAAALHVSIKSIQGWEIGNPIPEPILILTQLLHDLPEVRKRLLAA
jgi:DNA-binding XRE family transcriptional regulator